MKIHAIIVLLALCGLFTVETNAQINTPAASPTETTEITVGLTKVNITYARPSVKGRTIFAEDGLVPYGKAWRTGANSATKIEFADDVTLNGKAVEAGAYAVLTKPAAKEWEVMLFPYEGRSWSSYLEKTPALTLITKPQTLAEKVETFQIAVEDVKNSSAKIYMAWDKTKVSLPLSVSVDERVEENIAKVMAGPSQGDYHTAATYYQENGKDLKQALKWSQMANANEDTQRFWQVRREALIHAEMGDYAAAIDDAKRSRELAVIAEYDSYIRLNDASITEWTAKLKKKGPKKASTKKVEKMK